MSPETEITVFLSISLYRFILLLLSFNYLLELHIAVAEDFLTLLSVG